MFYLDLSEILDANFWTKISCFRTSLSVRFVWAQVKFAVRNNRMRAAFIPATLWLEWREEQGYSSLYSTTLHCSLSTTVRRASGINNQYFLFFFNLPVNVYFKPIIIIKQIYAPTMPTCTLRKYLIVKSWKKEDLICLQLHAHQP